MVTSPNMQPLRFQTKIWDAQRCLHLAGQDSSVLEHCQPKWCNTALHSRATVFLTYWHLHLCMWGSHRNTFGAPLCSALFLPISADQSLVIPATHTLICCLCFFPSCFIVGKMPVLRAMENVGPHHVYLSNLQALQSWLACYTYT